jgi:AcrR family transcriptional regulator
MEKQKSSQIAGLGRFNSARKEDSLRRLRAAAADLFSEKGYHSVSTEDIALAAGVTRKTFYQHFSAKADIALEVYKKQQAEVAHYWLEICQRDYRDPAEICAWLNHMVDGLTASAIARVFIIEFSLADKGMSGRIRDMAATLVHVLGKQIPEFQFTEKSEADEKRFAHASLLVNQIMNQITMFNAGLSNIRRDLLIERLAKYFTDYLLESSAHGKSGTAKMRHPKAKTEGANPVGSPRGSASSRRTHQHCRPQPDRPSR